MGEKNTKNRICLRVGLKESEQSISIPLTLTGPLRIGRSLENEIAINSPRVFPFHAEISPSPDGLILRTSTGGQAPIAPGETRSVGSVILSLPGNGPGLASPAEGKKKSPPLRIILFALIGIALAALFLIPAPSPQEPLSLRESLRDEIDPGQRAGSPSTLPASSLTPAERIRLADLSLSLGEQRLKDWKISVENAGLARAELEKAAALIEGINPHPPFSPRITARLEEAESLIEEEFRRRKFIVEKAIRFRDLDTAERELRELITFLHFPDDPRSRYAQERLRDIGRSE